MPTLLFMPPQCFEHDTGIGHPESTGRLRAIDSILNAEMFSFLTRASNGPATREQLERVHEANYVSQILQYDDCLGYVEIDPDTIISGGSVQGALYAAGAACAAVDEVLRGTARNAFCAIRPPGHHAEADKAMGFCLFNNAAVAALHARHEHGIKKIAVVDFDVHHGNGVQSIFWDDENLFYASVHENGGYPRTGPARETGAHNNILNAPLRPGGGSAELHQAWSEKIEPGLRKFSPDLIIVSAGFDAHEHDRMSQLNYSTADYAWMSDRIVRLAKECCEGRIISLLEGGYDLPSLAASVSVHVKIMMEGGRSDK